MGRCSPQCALSCFSRCNPICCTSKLAPSAYSPALHPVFPSYSQTSLPPIGIPQTRSQTPLSNPCVRTLMNPCLPRTPIMANMLPFSSTPNLAKPCIAKGNKKCSPKYSFNNRLPFGKPPSLPVPCVPTPIKPCPPIPAINVGMMRLLRPTFQPFGQIRAFQFPSPIAQPQMAAPIYQGTPPPFLKYSPKMAKFSQFPLFGLPFSQVPQQPFAFPMPKIPKCIPSSKRSCHPTVRNFENLRAKSKAKLRKLQQASRTHIPTNINSMLLPTLQNFYPNQPMIIEQPVIYQPIPQKRFGTFREPMTYRFPPQTYSRIPPLKATGKNRSTKPRVAGNPLFYDGAFGPRVSTRGNNFLPQLFQQNFLPYPPIGYPQYRLSFPPLSFLKPPVLPFNQPSIFPPKNKAPPFLKLSPGMTKPPSLPMYGSGVARFPTRPGFFPFSNRVVFPQFPSMPLFPPMTSSPFSQFPTLQKPLAFNRAPPHLSKTLAPNFLKLSANHAKIPKSSSFFPGKFPKFPPLTGAPFPLPLMSMMKNPPRIIPQVPSSVPNFPQLQQSLPGGQLSIPPLQLPPGGPLQFPQSRAPFPLPLPSMMKNPPPFLRAYINSKSKAPSPFMPPRPPPAMFPQRTIGFQQQVPSYQSPTGINMVGKPPPFLKLPTSQKNPQIPLYGRPLTQPLFLPVARSLAQLPFHPYNFLRPYQRNTMPKIECPKACSKNASFCPDYCPHKCCINGGKKKMSPPRILHVIKPKDKSKSNITTKQINKKVKKVIHPPKKNSSHHT